jgi:hypothetical protein
VATKLNQVVGLVVGAKANANKQTAPLFHSLKVPALFAGLTQRYEPLEEGGEQLPDDNTRVQMTVPEILAAFAKPNGRMLDLISTAENANTEARADVVVDENVIIKDAPVTFLMQFQKFLEQEVRGIIRDLPVLDPAQEWQPAASARPGEYQTDEFKSHRTKKMPRVISLAKATDKHPEQVSLVHEDVIAGYWHKKRFSGAVPAGRKAELTERVEKLIAAVNVAREKANDREVTDKPVGDAVFGYLFA